MSSLESRGLWKIWAASAFCGSVIGAASVAGWLWWRSARTECKRDRASRLPQRIILVRHGESAGNVDRKLFQTVPDFAHPLTELGHSQAARTGLRLASIVKGARVALFWSPYRRTRETMCEIRAALDSSGSRIVLAREDSRLREQEFGSWRVPLEQLERIEQERKEYGRFWYR